MISYLLIYLLIKDMISGYEVVAKALALQNLTHAFGIVGIPIVELGMSLQSEGLKYLGFRNE